VKNGRNTNKETKMETIEPSKAQIDALQDWFAAKPYGWRETATPGQLQQWADREREEAGLVARLEMLEA